MSLNTPGFQLPATVVLWWCKESSDFEHYLLFCWLRHQTPLFCSRLAQGGPALSTAVFPVLLWCCPASSESTVTSPPLYLSSIQMLIPLNQTRSRIHYIWKAVKINCYQTFLPQAPLPSTALPSSCWLYLGTASLKSQRALYQEARKQPSHLCLGITFPLLYLSK